MSRCLSVCLCLMIVPLLSASSGAAFGNDAAAADGLDWESVSKEIIASYEKISSFYHAKGVSVSGERFNYWSDGEERHIDTTITVLKGMELVRVHDPKAGLAIINAHNDRYAFKIEKQDDDSPWELVNQTRDPFGLNDKANNHLDMIPITEELFGGFIIYDFLKDIIQSDSFVLKSLRAAEDGNSVVFEFEANYSVSELIHIFGGTVELMKPYWVVKHYDIHCPSFHEGQPPQDYSDNTDIDYYVIDDIPYPKSITHTISDPENKQSRHGVLFEQPQIGGVSKKLFRLSYYGIAEPENINTLSVRTRVVTVAVGIVLLLLGWGLRRRVLAAGRGTEKKGDVTREG
ncbi:MAG: hypothetical protein J6S27_06445 [Thermoguttaceae bacterium]|nr:hypothetical protein [Thermoguttaceae bacterium]